MLPTRGWNIAIALLMSTSLTLNAGAVEVVILRDLPPPPPLMTYHVFDPALADWTVVSARGLQGNLTARWRSSVDPGAVLELSMRTLIIMGPFMAAMGHAIYGSGTLTTIAQGLAIALGGVGAQLWVPVESISGKILKHLPSETPSPEQRSMFRAALRSQARYRSSLLGLHTSGTTDPMPSLPALKKEHFPAFTEAELEIFKSNASNIGLPPFETEPWMQMRADRFLAQNLYLLSLGKHDSEAEQLARTLYSEHGDLQIKDFDQDEYRRHLSDDSLIEQRRLAAKIIKTLGIGRYPDLGEAFLEDPDPWVRAIAITAYSKAGGVVPPLPILYHRYQDPIVRLASIRHLVHTRQDDGGLEDAIQFGDLHDKLAVADAVLSNASSNPERLWMLNSLLQDRQLRAPVLEMMKIYRLTRRKLQLAITLHAPIGTQVPKDCGFSLRSLVLWD